MNNNYISYFDTPLGKMILTANNLGLTGAYFKDQKNIIYDDFNQYINGENDIISKAKEWLNCYFLGEIPTLSVPICFVGTCFQKRVWEELMKIPYGKTVSYLDIANMVTNKQVDDICKPASARAVGGAVGRNRISIIVPCHRVIGKNKKMIGYSGGLDRKIKLLEIEGIRN